MDNNEDNDELASYFAAKKENEELKLKIERLETDLNSFVISAKNAEAYRKVLENKIIDKDISIDSMLFFLRFLNKNPPFWVKSYKKSIREFLLFHFPDH